MFNYPKSHFITRSEFEKVLCCLRRYLPNDGDSGPTGPVGPGGVTGPTGPPGEAEECDCGIMVYMSNGAVIVADGEGVEFTHTTGSGKVTVPNEVHLLSFGLHGSLSFLANGNYDLEVEYVWNTGVNNAAGNLWIPTFDVIEASSEQVGGPSTGLPFQYTGTQTLNAPQRQIISIGNGNVKFRIANLDAYSNWLIKLTF